MKNTEAQKILGHDEGGKGGKGGAISLSNGEFFLAIFSSQPLEAVPVVCTRNPDHANAGWIAIDGRTNAAYLLESMSNYLGCSSYRIDGDGKVKAQKRHFAACHFLMLDDIGTKVPFEKLKGFELSWLIETSPGNFQGGIILKEPITDQDLASSTLDSMIDAGLCDKGANSPMTRWARLPVGVNGKESCRSDDGTPFSTRLWEWAPEKRYHPHEVLDFFGINAITAAKQKSVAATAVNAPRVPKFGGVYQAAKAENPVLTALKNAGLYKSSITTGKHDITCPWLDEHTDQIDHGTVYFEPSEEYPTGGFRCQHSHGDNRHIADLLEVLEVSQLEAQNKPVIQTTPGKLDAIVSAAEDVLARTGRFFYTGGLIVRLNRDPQKNQCAVLQVGKDALHRILSDLCRWERFDKNSKEWVVCDPPSRYVKSLHGSQDFKYLPKLSGFSRHPYFDTNGELKIQHGYDHTTQRYSLFDGQKYVISPPTQQDAMVQLKVLEDLIAEVSFASPEDRAGALAAIFTAVLRSHLQLAPAFHVQAHVPASGKTYLCELIGAFTGAENNTKLSYPTTSEEATKQILSSLIQAPAVIEFDDMDTDMIPHGVIKRMLTANEISDRLLGASQLVTVSTRVLMLSSGNNVGPIRDLTRRVLVIRLDPLCATPATRTYGQNPVSIVRENLPKYASAVLSIINAWKQSGAPKPNVKHIATYGGDWADNCRFPLIWLGLPDPASRLLENATTTPESQSLGLLLSEWHQLFGSTPITIRDALKTLGTSPGLEDALLDLPVMDRDKVNPTKLGQWLAKNEGRIVNDKKFVKATAKGRKAWQVKIVLPPPLPPLPPSS